MRRLLKKGGDIFDRFLTLLSGVSSVFIIFVMLLISTDVVMRYAFSNPIPWSLETVEVLLLWMTFLTAAWLLRREGHIKIDILTSRLSPRTQVALHVFSSIVGVIVCLVILWFGAKVSHEALVTGAVRVTVLRPPYFPILVAIPIGSFLLVIQFIRRGYGYLQQLRSSAS